MSGGSPRDAYLISLLHWTLFDPELKLLKQSSEPVTALKHETKTSNGKRQV